jgi:hypothetical protein
MTGPKLAQRLNIAKKWQIGRQNYWAWAWLPIPDYIAQTATTLKTNIFW